MARKSKKSGSWLKRVVIAMIAAVAALLFTKRTVLAPSQAKSEYKLPPVPESSVAGSLVDSSMKSGWLNPYLCI